MEIIPETTKCCAIFRSKHLVVGGYRLPYEIFNRGSDKTILGIVLVAFIVGAAAWLHVRKKNKK